MGRAAIGDAAHYLDTRIEAVIVRTLETQPPDATHWSSRDMARASGLSVSTVQRIWRAKEFRKFLDEIEAAVPDDLDVHTSSWTITQPIRRR